jgi:outer membrane protein assembly factor BamB
MVAKVHTAVFLPPNVPRIIWQNSINAPINRAAAIGADARIYVPQARGRVFCFDASGAPLWHFPKIEPVLLGVPGEVSEVAVGNYKGNDRAYFTIGTRLYAADGKTGEEIWRYELGNAPSTPPIVTPTQVIYIGVGNGVLALKAKVRAASVSGGGPSVVPEPLWNVNVGEPVNHLAVGENGFLYGATPNRLFRIE